MEELWLGLWPYIRDLNEILMVVELVSPTFGVLATLISGWIIHRIQVRNARILPFVPSYSETMVGTHSSSTRFYAAVHDMAMSVTEAWNTMNSRTQNRGSVEEHLNQSQLRQICTNVHEYSGQMRQEFAEYDGLDTEIQRCIVLLVDSWSYDSNDNYRTEAYTVTRTDSKGNPKIETKTRQVYDSTDHYFTFSRGAAQEALQSMESIQRLYEKANLVPPNVAENRVDLAQLDEVERMFLKRLFQQTVKEDTAYEPTDEELTTTANQWLVKTKVDGLLMSFEKYLVDALKVQADAFGEILGSNARYHYNTNSRSHSGPRGYRAAYRLREPLQYAVTRWTDLESLWKTCQDTATSLMEWVSDSDVIEKDKAYAKMAVQTYEKAFPGSSIDIDQLTKPGMAILFALLIGIVVAGLVFAGHPNGLARELW